MKDELFERLYIQIKDQTNLSKKKLKILWNQFSQGDENLVSKFILNGEWEE